MLCCDGTWDTPTDRTDVSLVPRPGHVDADADDSGLGSGGDRGAATLTVTWS